MTLAQDIAKFSTDAELAHQVVHGASNVTVTTEGGPVKTLAKLMADNQLVIDASGLKTWAITQAFQLVSATRNADGAITTATIAWPDGVSGVFTSDTLSTAFPGAIDAWHATYLGAVTKTVTQPAVTRDATGAVTIQPAITIV